MNLKKLYLESEETEIDSDVKNIANQLGAEIKDVLTQSNQVEEALDPVSILSLVLTSNTVLHLLSGWVSKMMTKYDIGRGKEAIDKINTFTHKMEDDFKSPIRRVVSLFVKDGTTADKITNALFLVLILSLSLRCGLEAYNHALKSDVVSSIMSGVKTVAKGVDIAAIVKKLAQA